MSDHRQSSFFSSRLVLSLLLLGVVAVWGWTFVLVKRAIAEFGVVPFLAVRFAIAAAVMAPFTARWCGGRSLAVGALVGLALAGGFLLQTLGLDLTTATSSGLITGLFVVFAPLANRALFGVRTPGKLWFAIAAAVGGLYLLTCSGPEATVHAGTGAAELSRRGLGDLLTVLCAACFGLHVALLDRAAKRYPPAALAQGQITMAALVYLAVWPAVQPLALPSASVWPALLITGLLATAAAYIIQTLAQRRLSAVEVAMIMFLEPLFAALFGLVAGDRLTLVQLAGGAIMLGAFAVVEVYPRWAERKRAGRNGR
ncbi:MAG: threonine and homoserine efflux system [Planctomycetes bacterium ADurb.Bin126]|nr:MAG: threonine and homoserine efflux system [Planctomycetes bacterium ADurb.Bin126]HOD80517.1 DMT family transporter [Phycisphaerae bacterium]HQL72129.1 DMT family transporter [Phycisphaerae bacterium]